MEEKRCYSLTTRRLRLCCRHPEWLLRTQELYNQIEEFYYNLMLENPQFRDISSQKTLRELEILSIPGRDGRVPVSPLPWKKVPLYFRRSAANAGIAAAKSHFTRNETAPGRTASSLNSAVVYYKGMYRDFSSSEITLKVYDGQKWTWMHCRLYGKGFPKDAQILSPSVVFEYKYLMLHVPIKEYGGDARTVSQRMEAGENICAIQFTNSDIFAVGTILDVTGNELAVKFWGGGKEHTHRCNELLKKIEKSRNSSGKAEGGKLNQKYWMKLKNLVDTHAHQVSAEIVRFCRENNAALVVFPKYSEGYSLRVMKASGDWSPIHLSSRIRKYITYKAWRQGIVSIEVHANAISSVCAKCGAPVIIVDKENNEYQCENGHRGSRYLNAARNLGKKCLIQFGKQVG